MADEAFLSMVRKAILDLHETIKEFNKQSEKHTAQMLRLTRVIAVLTLVMAVLVGVQIVLMFK
jgi:hypothetical protein